MTDRRRARTCLRCYQKVDGLYNPDRCSPSDETARNIGLPNGPTMEELHVAVCRGSSAGSKGQFSDHGHLATNPSGDSCQDPDDETDLLVWANSIERAHNEGPESSRASEITGRSACFDRSILGFNLPLQ